MTGDVEKAEQSCKLWIQSYPRAEMPHIYLSGAIYPVLGRYESVVEEAREAIRLQPDTPISYFFLMSGHIALNRPHEAKTTYRQTIERKVFNALDPIALYQIAFLQNDISGMEQQGATSAGQRGIEDVMLGLEAETAAYSGRLKDSLEFSRRAMDSAGRSAGKEAAATYLALSGLREALFGNADEARRRATLAIERSAGRDVQYGSALALAYVGDDRRAQTLTDDLSKRFTEDTIVKFNYLPTLRAILALRRRNTSEALETLRAAVPYELGQTTGSSYGWTALYPVFVRGEAFLAAQHANEAAAEFQGILITGESCLTFPSRSARPSWPRSRLRSMQGVDMVKAKAAYQDFLTLWKDADPDIPILKEAKAEYAKLAIAI